MPTAPDYYGIIEPRRAAEIALTPGGLSGDETLLDSPPVKGSEEGWFSAQLSKLRELAATANQHIGQAKGAAKRRLQRALKNLGDSAKAGARAVKQVIPARKDLADGFQSLFDWSTKLQLASGVTQLLLGAALVWALKELSETRAARSIF